MTYTYIVSINEAPKRADEYRYTYAQTKGIVISIGRKGAKITASLGKDYSAAWEGSYAQQLVFDGIKRCALVYVLRYKAPILIKTVRITVLSNAQISSEFDISDTVKLYSLFEGKLYKPISPNLLGRNTIATIVGEMKKDYGKRTAALYAYILSKCELYEAERFVYLWMAFNGVYGYWGQEEGVRRDTKQIIHLLEKYNWGTEITKNEDERTKAGRKVSLLLNQRECLLSYEFLNSAGASDLKKEIFALPEVKDIDISLYGYLLCDYCYYLRCTMIHANKPLPLFAFEGEMEIKVLRTANNLLEEFLDDHLYECFEERD